MLDILIGAGAGATIAYLLRGIKKGDDKKDTKMSQKSKVTKNNAEKPPEATKVTQNNVKQQSTIDKIVESDTLIKDTSKNQEKKDASDSKIGNAGDSGACDSRSPQDGS